MKGVTFAVVNHIFNCLFFFFLLKYSLVSDGVSSILMKSVVITLN